MTVKDVHMRTKMLGLMLECTTPNCSCVEREVDGTTAWLQDCDGFADGGQHAGADSGGPVGGVQWHAADLLPHHAAETWPLQP